DMKQELEANFLRHVAQTSDAPIILHVDRAEGIYLIDQEGRSVIDFISGICVSNLGHNDPDIRAAIHAQTDRYLHPNVYGEVIMTPQVSYAKRLCGALGEPFDAVYFGNSGAESIEGALKVAKKFTGRGELIAFENAYHGSTHGALSVTGKAGKKEGYGPLLPNVSFLPFNEIEPLSTISPNTAAVIVEVIQGAGGIVLPKPGFLSALRARCDEVGALLIFDEIQTGFGRSGSLFAFQQFGCVPDIIVLAKALGGGMPLGAFVCRQEIMQVIRRNPPLGHLTTFGGHPVSCAAGMALLDKLMASDLLTQIPAKAAVLREMLVHPAIRELRGMGMMYAILFDDYETADQIRAACLRRGLLTIGFLSIDNGLRITPPLTITEGEMKLACQIILDAIAEVVGGK
ncbi:MAG: aspartate aminotransferase family protein, partial [Bacteroidota bacterium]